MADTLNVTAQFVAKPDCVDGLIAVLSELAGPSRSEPGCQEYAFYQDLVDHRVVVAIEAWRDESSFEAHLETAHFKSAFEKLGGLLEAEPIIRKLHKII